MQRLKTRSFGFLLLFVSACLWSVGCSGGSDSTGRFTVSGEVTYKGKPIPVGFIRFSPDTSKGNRGPGGGAPIKDGHFKTPRNKGIIGGAYTIAITGTDGIPTTEDGEEVPDGKRLFRMHQTIHEFPKEDTEWDFEVPAR